MNAPEKFFCPDCGKVLGLAINVVGTISIKCRACRGYKLITFKQPIA